MTAKSETVTCTQGTWTQLNHSSTDITSLTFQVVRGRIVLVKGTTTASAPSDAEGALMYKEGEGELNVAMSDLFPGVSGADNIYALCPYEDGEVMVSHA